MKMPTYSYHKITPLGYCLRSTCACRCISRHVLHQHVTAPYGFWG